MITFIASIVALILGYIFYGRFLDKYFGMNPDRPTPVHSMADGIDYVPMKPWKVFIIQFLNIAGVGPIFGAILGAAYGPVAYLWIVFGCIFIGGVLDYLSGMLSIWNRGISLPTLIGKFLGNSVFIFLIVITGVLLVAAGSSFVTAPAELLANLTGSAKIYWLAGIFIYYIIATLVPIDKIIGRIYPYLGILLLFMAVAIGCAIIFKGINGSITLTELTPATFKNFHRNPETNILIPMLFIVISCGAVSGFHGTQSTMMARCITNEKYGRPCFYGAMICEGIIATVWATAAIAYFGGPDGLNEAFANGMTPAIAVETICNSWLGKVGAAIAIVGVVACPVTTGDTAFRSLRLIIADGLKFDQKPLKNRLFIAIPMFIVSYLLCRFDFSTIWRYVGITNQIIAAVTIWMGAHYLAIRDKNHLILSIPAIFVTYICIAYILVSPNSVGGCGMNYYAGNTIAITFSLLQFILFIIRKHKHKIVVRS